MTGRLARAIVPVTRFWRIITVLGLANTALVLALWYGALRPEVFVFATIATACLTVAVYGQVASHLVTKRIPSILGAIREHWFNYFVVVIIVGLPWSLSRFLLGEAFSSRTAQVGVSTAIRVMAHVVTMYALPIALCRHWNLRAIVQGVSFLSHRIEDSLWIAVIILVVDVGRTVGTEAIGPPLDPWSVAAMSAGGLLGTFGSMVAFAGALQTYLREQAHDTSPPARICPGLPAMNDHE